MCAIRNCNNIWYEYLTNLWVSIVAVGTNLFIVQCIVWQYSVIYCACLKCENACDIDIAYPNIAKWHESVIMLKFCPALHQDKQIYKLYSDKVIVTLSVNTENKGQLNNTSKIWGLRTMSWELWCIEVIQHMIYLLSYWCSQLHPWFLKPSC